jgi:hypothetical protein
VRRLGSTNSWKKKERNKGGFARVSGPLEREPNEKKKKKEKRKHHPNRRKQ